MILSQRCQVTDRRKYRQQKVVLEITNERGERMKMHTNSCMRIMNRVEMSKNGVTCRQSAKGLGDTVGRFRKSVSMKTAIKYRRDATLWENLRGRRLSVRGREVKRLLDSHLSKRVVSVAHHTRAVCST